MDTATLPKVTAIEPLGDNVLVLRKSTDEFTTGGVLLPDSAREKPKEGTVIAVGPGHWVGKERRAMSVVAGDRVVFSNYGGSEIKQDGIEYLLIPESDILGIVREKEPA